MSLVLRVPRVLRMPLATICLLRLRCFHMRWKLLPQGASTSRGKPIHQSGEVIPHVVEDVDWKLHLCLEIKCSGTFYTAPTALRALMAQGNEYDHREDIGNHVAHPELCNRHISVDQTCLNSNVIED